MNRRTVLKLTSTTALLWPALTLPDFDPPPQRCDFDTTKAYCAAHILWRERKDPSLKPYHRYLWPFN